VSVGYLERGDGWSLDCMSPKCQLTSVLMGSTEAGTRWANVPCRFWGRSYKKYFGSA